MAKKYLEELIALVDQATLGKFRNIKLEYKHFFSGAALYADERICMSLTPVGFAIKLPEEKRDILLKQKGTKHLQYFPKGPIKKDYVVLPKSIFKDMEALRHLVGVSIKYALSLPKPVRKKNK